MNKNEKLAHDLVRMILIVFVSRGFFSGDLLHRLISHLRSGWPSDWRSWTILRIGR